MSAGDINNDRLIDLNMVPNKLFLNKGGLKFEDIPDSAGWEGIPDGTLPLLWRMSIMMVTWIFIAP